MATKSELCKGCRDDWYNSKVNNPPNGVCFSLESAQVVTRFKLRWWSEPSAQSYVRVTTLSCWHSPGNFAMHKKLPDFVNEAEVRDGV